MKKALVRGCVAFSVAVLINAALAIGMSFWTGFGDSPREHRPIRSNMEIPFVKTPPPKKKAAARKSSTRRMEMANTAMPALSIPSAIAVPAFSPQQIQASSVVHPTTGRSKFSIGEETILTEDMVDDPPQPLLRTPLRYPKSAEAKGIEGEVEARLLLGSDGSVLQVKILSAKPPGVFESAAQESLSTWRFSPATFRGQKLKAWVRQRVVFKLH